jgi:hypothetical protein
MPIAPGKEIFGAPLPLTPKSDGIFPHHRVRNKLALCEHGMGFGIMRQGSGRQSSRPTLFYMAFDTSMISLYQLDKGGI